jgi:hypothetical protein
MVSRGTSSSRRGHLRDEYGVFGVHLGVHGLDYGFALGPLQVSLLVEVAEWMVALALVAADVGGFAGRSRLSRRRCRGHGSLMLLLARKQLNVG